MIIIQLTGGLGNQMFQYAAGISLATHLNTTLKLDISIFEREYHGARQFALSCFIIDDEIASMEEVRAIRKQGLRNSLIRLKESFLPPAKKSVYRAPFFHYDDNFFNCSDNTYLEGFFQSEKYFLNVKPLIKNKFAFREELDPCNQVLAELILKSQSVSIHVRRSDYITNVGNARIFHTCDNTYYQRCIELIGRQILSPQYFIFSDDIEWAEKNLPINAEATIVKGNTGNKSYIDMHLSSLCKHNIIANSSFSWWGAWLNSNKEKIVLAPHQWFKDKSKNTKDIIPSSWKIV